MGWRGWLQRFRSGRSGEPARRTNRNAVAAFSPALTDAVGLRWVNGQNENNSEGVVAAWRRIGCNSFRVDELVETVPKVAPKTFVATLG